MAWTTSEGHGQTLYKQPDEVSDPYMCSWKYKANQEIKWKIQEVIIQKIHSSIIVIINLTPEVIYIHGN